MDDIDEEELRSEFLKALGALELNASSSEDEEDVEVYYESEDYDVEDEEDARDKHEGYDFEVEAEEGHSEDEENGTVFYNDEDDLYYEDDDDVDVPDAYDWPDRSALDRLVDVLSADDVLVEDEHALIEPESDGNVAGLEDSGLGDSGSQDTVEDNEVDNTSDSVDEVKSLGQEVARKKKKKNKRKKKGKCPPVQDDAFEDAVQDLEVLERTYDMSTSADDRFRKAMENFRNARKFTELSTKILSTFFSHGHMDSNRDFSAVNKDGHEVEMHVDFIYVVSTFLSSMAEKRGWYERSYFELAPKIVAGFLKYLLRHHVLPEYETELRQAVEVAEKAKVESPRCHSFNKLMPDDLSLTLSVTYLPSYYVVADLPLTTDPFLKSVGIDSVGEAPLKSTRFLTVWNTASEEDAAEDLSRPESTELKVVMTAAAADLLRVGTVLQGTFYTLENGITFARPLQAHPSFFVEIDDQ